MERQIGTKYKLYAASSHSVPALVDTTNGLAYGPGDLAGFLRTLPARSARRLLDALLRLADDTEGRELLDRFLQEGGAREDQTD